MAETATPRGTRTFAAAMTVAVLLLLASAWMFITRGDPALLFFGALAAGVVVIVAWIRLDAAGLGMEPRPWMTLVVVVPVLLVGPLYAGGEFSMVAYLAAVAVSVAVVLAYLVAREVRLAHQK